MKQATNKRRLLSNVVLLLGLVALGWLMAGCGGTEATAVDTDTTAQVVLEPTAVIATATSEVDPTPEPEEAAIVVEATIDTCTDCHTDKDLLIDTADPVEEVINENEGEG